MSTQSTINILSYAWGVVIPNTAQGATFIQVHVQKTLKNLLTHDPTALGIIAQESTPENIELIFTGIDERTSAWGEFRNEYRSAVIRALSDITGFSHHNCTPDAFAQFQMNIQIAQDNQAKATQKLRVMR